MTPATTRFPDNLVSLHRGEELLRPLLEGRLDDFEVGRDVEVGRRIEAVVPNMQDLPAPELADPTLPGCKALDTG